MEPSSEYGYPIRMRGVQPSGGRTISPTREQLSKLRTPLTTGESEVLEFFDELLDPGWEIYVQPFMNGLRPDFVLLNPAVGVAVFEVKDWNLAATEYRPGSRLGWIEVCDPRTHERFGKRSPFDQVGRYGEELRSIYCPLLGEQARIPLLTTGVVMTAASTDDAQTLCDPEIQRVTELGRRYRPVSGRDALEARDCEAVFPESQRSSSSRMNEEIVLDLRRWLVDPCHASEQRDIPPMDGDQRRFATTRTAMGFRRIRGPAGSGKTTVVAARAAALAAEGRTVLVVSFNHTLRNYLRDLFVRFSRSRRDPQVVWLGFHEWCKRTMHDAGFGDEYKALWQGRDDEGGRVLDHGMADATADAIDQGPFRAALQTFDAILVDEGQDFVPEWWAALRKVLKPGGEMLLVADRAQDIYKRNSLWTEQTMEGAGFSGPWSELKTGYRMPRDLQSLSERLAEEFALEGVEEVEPRDQQELDYCDLKWEQVEPDELTDALMRAFSEAAGSELKFSMTDITFIVDSKELGGSLVEALEGATVKTLNTFADDSRAERRAKYAFFKGGDRVKVTTIHSFKGWETPVLIVGLGSSDVNLAYAALTRLSRAGGGSYLHVVCGNEKFARFGAGWENLEA